MTNTQKNIASGIIWGLFFAGTFYLSGALGTISSVFALAFYMGIIWIFVAVWKTIQGSILPKFSEYLASFFYRSGVLVTVICGVLGLFGWHQNMLSPAFLPRYTITDGKKTIIFQTMAHMATDRFYERVREQIRVAKKQGYVLFFEGVRPGTPENMKKFNEAMGIVFDKSVYANLSRLYDLREQRNNELLNIENNKDYNADVAIDDIIPRYEKRLKESGKVTRKEAPIDIAPLIEASVKQLNDRELRLMVFINRAMMNFIMKNTSAQGAIIDMTERGDFFATILGDRNEHLVKTVLESPEDKIFVTYGMMHFDGVMQLLQEKNPNWHLAKVEYEYPIK